MKLEGTKVLLSGKFEGYSADELRAELVERGAQVVDSVAPDVEVVFAGAEAGLEVDEARELGIRISTEDDMKAALTGGEPPAKPLPPGSAAPVLPTNGPPDAPIGGSSAPVSQAAQSPAAPALNQPDDGDDEGARVFEKGARVKIVGGLEGVGTVGEIFWWGESKFGDGMRAGVSADDEQKYWVDEENLGWPDEEVPDEVMEAAEQASQFRRGDEVTVKSGKDAGAAGTIFWWGESKWGDGMRAGVETDDGEKVWVDAEHLERVEVEDDIPF